MKRLCLIIITSFFGYLILLTFTGFSAYNIKPSIIKHTAYDRPVDIQTIKAKILFNRKVKLVTAIIAIEKPTETCPAWKSYKKERAVGLLQQTPVFVRACNEIVGYKKYKYSDSNDSIKAVEMFFVYQNHHNPKYDYERAAYIQNGGENYKKASLKTKKKLVAYWNKVKKHL